MLNEASTCSRRLPKRQRLRGLNRTRCRTNTKRVLKYRLVVTPYSQPTARAGEQGRIACIDQRAITVEAAGGLCSYVAVGRELPDAWPPLRSPTPCAVAGIEPMTCAPHVPAIRRQTASADLGRVVRHQLGVAPR